MKFAPFKPCTLPKHVRVEILHREFPVKNLYFPCKGLQCVFDYGGPWGSQIFTKIQKHLWAPLGIV